MKRCVICVRQAELIDEYHCWRCMKKFPADEQGDCRPL